MAFLGMSIIDDLQFVQFTHLVYTCGPLPLHTPYPSLTTIPLLLGWTSPQAHGTVWFAFWQNFMLLSP